MNAEPARQPVDLLLELSSISADDNDLGTVLLGQLSLLDRRRGTNDVRSEVARDLAEVEADSAGGGVDEDPVALLDGVGLAKLGESGQALDDETGGGLEVDMLGEDLQMRQRLSQFLDR